MRVKPPNAARSPRSNAAATDIVRKHDDARAPHMPEISPELDASAKEILAVFEQAATPENTRSSYMKALRYLGGWAQARYGSPLPFPTPPQVVVEFLNEHLGTPVRESQDRVTFIDAMPAVVDQALVEGGYKVQLGPLKMSTIEHRLSVLSWAHHYKDLTSPTELPVIRRLMSNARKLARQAGQEPRSKTAITQPELDAMLKTCGSSLEDLRDKAILLFGWASGGRRRSEITEAWVDDFEWTSSTHAYFRMRRSKTNDPGSKSVRGDAAVALRAWMLAAEITEGPLFRRVMRGGRVVGTKALSNHTVAVIVKKRAEKAGLEGDFSGHSLRRGFVTESGAQKMALADAMNATGHRSIKSFLRYTEEGKNREGDVSNLLEIARKSRS